MILPIITACNGSVILCPIFCNKPGHSNVVKFRTQFSSSEEHHENIYDNLAFAVGKRDSIYLLGDVAFTREWLEKIRKIRAIKKTLLLGNHCTDQKVTIQELASVFDSIHSLHSRRNYWLSHCPIHPSEMRGKLGNIHGHTHHRCIDDKRYLNVCVERTGSKPITFAEALERLYY
ncbi:hypothetical protein ACWX0P_27895 [Vibrio mediterranei]